MLFAYLDERRMIEYWKKVVYNILHRMMVSAYIIYKQNSASAHPNNPISCYKFTVKKIVDSLLRRS